MTDEHEQLRSYARTGAEADFAGVVQRFLPLVYAAALRRVQGDSHRAEDVTQLVFIALARHAAALSRHPDLAGWLFTTTRFLAAKALRSERRRSFREREVSMSSGPLAADSTPGEASPVPLCVLLDDLVADLKPIDRQVILLRFHRGLRLAEIGVHLDATENAVQKRLDRALEQLREKLARRGVTSTATALIVTFEQQAGAATLPAGLAATATHAALALGASPTGLFGTLGFMTVSKLQLSLAAAVALAGGAGLLWQYQQNQHLRADLAQQTATADAKLADLQRQLLAQTAGASAAETDVATLLVAVQATAAPQPDVRPPTGRPANTQDVLGSTTTRARELIRAGKLQEALEEYLRGYHALRADPGGAPRSQILLSTIKNLGRTFPPATTALRNLRDSALQELNTKPNDPRAGREVALLNERLEEPRETLALYDRLPADSPLRQSFAVIAHETFVEARRYADAMVGKSYGSMLNEFDLAQRVNSQPASQGSGAAAFRATLIRKTALNIEALTGAGLISEAKSLTDKLLAYDRSDTTRTLVQQHVVRAQPAP